MRFKIKFLSFWLLATLFVLTISSMAYAQSHLTMDDQSCAAGAGEVTFTISANNIPNNVKDLSIEISHNPLIVIYKSSQKGNLTVGFNTFSVSVPKNGRLLIKGTTTTPIPAGSSGIIAQLTFIVKTCSNSQLIFSKIGGDLRGCSTKNGNLIAKDGETPFGKTPFGSTIIGGITFPGTTWPKTTFPGITFPGTTFPETRLPGITWPETTFPGTTLPKTTYDKGSLPDWSTYGGLVITERRTTSPITTLSMTTYEAKEAPSTFKTPVAFSAPSLTGGVYAGYGALGGSPMLSSGGYGGAIYTGESGASRGSGPSPEYAPSSMPTYATTPTSTVDEGHYGGSTTLKSTTSVSSSGGYSPEYGEEYIVEGDIDEPERPTIQSGMLTAGDIDDNKYFDYFIGYLNSKIESDQDELLPPLIVYDRVTIRIVDDSGQGVSNARVSVYKEGKEFALIETYAGTDGIFYFFPTIDGAGTESLFTIEVRPPENKTPSVYHSLDLDSLDADQVFDIVLEGVSNELPDSLDLMLVIDTTGSMHDELQYLTTELRDIIESVQNKHPGIALRLGLIVYRDIGDEYVVRNLGWTTSVNVMQEQLEKQVARGGGDYPEAVEQALAEAISEEWRTGNTARLLVHVADAPPHDENLQAALNEAKTARRKGLRIYPLAASGVAETAEFLMRSSACVTQGRYLFLTDDSGVGNPHAEPEIRCYVVTRLDQLLIRVIDSELAGRYIEPPEDQIIRKVGPCYVNKVAEDQDH